MGEVRLGGMTNLLIGGVMAMDWGLGRAGEEMSIGGTVEEGALGDPHLLDVALHVFGNWVLSRCHAQQEWDRVDLTDEDRARFMKLLTCLAVINNSAKEFVGSTVEFAAHDFCMFFFV